MAIKRGGGHVAANGRLASMQITHSCTTAAPAEAEAARMPGSGSASGFELGSGSCQVGGVGRSLLKVVVGIAGGGDNIGPSKQGNANRTLTKTRHNKNTNDAKNAGLIESFFLGGARCCDNFRNTLVPK